MTSLDVAARTTSLVLIDLQKGITSRALAPRTAAQVADLIGFPEAVFPLSQATIYLAHAPKSNGVKRSYFAAAADASATARLPVPLHLRNAVTPLMKSVGYGEGYRYVHDDPAAQAEMTCLPEELRGRRYENS